MLVEMLSLYFDLLSFFDSLGHFIWFLRSQSRVENIYLFMDHCFIFFLQLQQKLPPIIKFANKAIGGIIQEFSVNESFSRLFACIL